MTKSKVALASLQPEEEKGTFTKNQCPRTNAYIVLTRKSAGKVALAKENDKTELKQTTMCGIHELYM